MTWLEPPFPWEAPGLLLSERRQMYAEWCAEVRTDQELKFLERSGQEPRKPSDLVQIEVRVEEETGPNDEEWASLMGAEIDKLEEAIEAKKREAKR